MLGCLHPHFYINVFFGTDIPDREQLIAYNRTVDEICAILGADSLGYLKQERLSEICGNREFCHGCFTGEWPIDAPQEDIRGDYNK